MLASASNDHTVRTMEHRSKGMCGAAHILQRAESGRWNVAPPDAPLPPQVRTVRVRVWDLDSHQPLTTLRGYSNKTWSLAFCKDSSRLIAGNEDSLVRVWDIREATTTLELRGHASRVWAIARSPDGRWVASASDDLTIRLWDLESGVCKYVMQGHLDWIRSIVFSSDSRLLASAAEDGRIMFGT